MRVVTRALSIASIVSGSPGPVPGEGGNWAPARGAAPPNNIAKETNTARRITNAGTFFLFAFLTLTAAAYFWRRVPETKGKPLPE